MAEALEIEAHYKKILADLDATLAQVESATEALTAAALAGDPVDLNDLRAAHALVVDAHGVTSNLTGAPVGNPVPDTGPGAPPLPPPPGPPLGILPDKSNDQTLTEAKS